LCKKTSEVLMAAKSKKKGIEGGQNGGGTEKGTGEGERPVGYRKKGSEIKISDNKFTKKKRNRSSAVKSHGKLAAKGKVAGRKNKGIKTKGGNREITRYKEGGWWVGSETEERSQGLFFEHGRKKRETRHRGLGT